MNNRINRLHERALKLAYKEPHLTFEELLVKDKSFTIHHRNLQKLAIEMYKFHKNLSPEIMKCIFQESNITYIIIIIINVAGWIPTVRREFPCLTRV